MYRDHVALAQGTGMHLLDGGPIKQQCSLYGRSATAHDGVRLNGGIFMYRSSTASGCSFWRCCRGAALQPRTPSAQNLPCRLLCLYGRLYSRWLSKRPINAFCFAICRWADRGCRFATRYLNCVEHALGLEDWAKYHNATVIATNDKEGNGSSTSHDRFCQLPCRALLQTLACLR